MASGGIDRDAKDALLKLLQIGTMAEYQDEFEMLINRLTMISESLLTSFYISGLKVALQIELLRERPTTLGEAFSLAPITETHFEDERSASAIAKPNDLNTRAHVQDLEETTSHNPNKVEAIKSSRSSLLVESKDYAAKVMKRYTMKEYYSLPDSCASICVSISWTLGMICKSRIYNSKRGILESFFLDNTLRASWF
nr:reverse transcriptase [Tanacetum cinerariifolium]